MVDCGADRDCGTGDERALAVTHDDDGIPALLILATATPVFASRAYELTLPAGSVNATNIGTRGNDESEHERDAARARALRAARAHGAPLPPGGVLPDPYHMPRAGAPLLRGGEPAP